MSAQPGPRPSNCAAPKVTASAAPVDGVPAPSPQLVQYWVDRAAHFNMFSMPDHGISDAAISSSGNRGGIVGFRIAERLHRFDTATSAPVAGRPVKARNVVGEAAGKFTHRWMLIPDDFVASMNREPPPTLLVPSQSQRFVMLDSRCTFGDGNDGFRGFGTGQTLPTTVRGQPQLLATAVGTIIEGFGKFKGNEEGTYVYCGILAPERGFTGNLFLRVMDPRETLRTESAPPPIKAGSHPERETTYLVFRGQAVPSDLVTPRLGPGGRPAGLNVEQGIRLLSVDFQASGYRGLESVDSVGPLIGKVTANVTFDPTAPGGTPADPIPFTAHDEFAFFDQNGDTVGAFTATSAEGRVFNTEIAGQPGLRFGGTGRVLSGSGSFEGMSGLMTDNSLVLFTPHVSASVYVLRIHDPRGRFRAMGL